MKIKFSKKKDANDAGSTVTVEATAEKKEEQKTEKKKFFQKKPKLTAEEALKRLDEIQRVSFIKLADNITELNNINARYNDISYFRSAVNNVTVDKKERKAADELCKVIAEELAFQLRKEYYATHNDENEYRGWMSEKINLYTRTIAIAMNDADWKDNIEKIIAGFMKNKNLHVFDAMITDIEAKEAAKKAEEEAARKAKEAEEAKKKAEEEAKKKAEEPKASEKKSEEEKESKGFTKFVKKKEEKVAKTMDFSKFVKPKEVKEPINPMPNPIPNMVNPNVVNMPNQRQAQPTDEEIINKMKSNSTYNVDMFKVNIINDPKFFKWHKPRNFSTEQINTLYDMTVSEQLIAQAKQFGAITQPMFIVPGVAPMEAMPTLVEVKLSDYYKFDKKKDSKKKYEYAFELEYPGKDPTHPIIMLVNITDRTMNIQKVHKHD